MKESLEVIGMLIILILTFLFFPRNFGERAIDKFIDKFRKEKKENERKN